MGCPHWYRCYHVHEYIAARCRSHGDHGDDHDRLCLARFASVRFKSKQRPNLEIKFVDKGMHWLFYHAWQLERGRRRTGGRAGAPHPTLPVDWRSLRFCSCLGASSSLQRLYCTARSSVLPQKRLHPPYNGQDHPRSAHRALATGMYLMVPAAATAAAAALSPLLPARSVHHTAVPGSTHRPRAVEKRSCGDLW